MPSNFNHKALLATIPHRPGIYKMINAAGEILYVGKAKDLKKRVASYFRADINDKTRIFMRKVVNIEIIITESENAALLLESNLIKTLKPHYNILFKDDKSFPYLLLSAYDFPCLTVYRGAKETKGRYFGPFPNAAAVHATLDLIQKIFKLRQCNDNFFRNRSRPCIQYQIKRCTGPCVGCINKESYQRQVRLVEQFLTGKSDAIIKEITKMMEAAAENKQYELAAYYRDQIIDLRAVQQRQFMIKDSGDIDVVALAGTGENDFICINIIFVRNGLVVGDKSYFIETSNFNAAKSDEILITFLAQYYLRNESSEAGYIVPQKILLNIHCKDRLWLQAVLNEKISAKIKINDNAGGAAKKLLVMAQTNAEHALHSRHADVNVLHNQLLELKNIFQLKQLPKRIDCFDVSHTMGESTVASCVVFNARGPQKNEYRRFNIKSAAKSDDYAALREAVQRRYQQKIKSKYERTLPDMIIIDGGKGQLHVVADAMKELGVANMFLLAVAKGPTRKPGLEEIYTFDFAGCGQCDKISIRGPIVLGADAAVLHFIQQIRDEAHRFAITGHRNKLAKARRTSVLENIAGIGAKRRTALLQHFGGLQEIESASVDEIAKVQGINKQTAQKIYDYLHSDLRRH